MTPELYSETKWPEHAILQEKKVTPVIIKKSAAKSRTPAPANQRAISFSETITPAAPPKQDQHLRGKHSRLRRELSLAISTSVDKCSVVHQEDPYLDMPELELSSDEEEDEESDDETFFCSPSGMRKKFEKDTEFLDTFWGQDIKLNPQDKSTINNIVMGAEVSPLEPKNIQEALQSENREHWKEAIDEEMRQHELNGTFSSPKILPLRFQGNEN